MPQLHAPLVYVRIRPKCTSGGHADETKVAKRLHGWTDKTVQLKDRHSITDYVFPTQVLPPDISQATTYETTLAPLAQQFVQHHNVCFFAYGQTGTGKTHSIFGPQEALKSSTIHAEWGLFPRLMQDIFHRLDVDSSLSYQLDAQAVEFYMFECFDLLQNRKPALLDKQFEPGAVAKQLNNMDDVMTYLETVRNSRTAHGTRMNEATDEHGGSSRSHCALILTLRQVDRSTNTYVKTRLNLVDLAGAERPGKNGYERQGVFEAMMNYYYGGAEGKKKIVASQAAVINYELAQLAQEVVKATDVHRQKKPYSAPTQVCLPMIQYLAGCFNGKYRLGMLVCLSQALNCGWETWFSLQYGTDLSNLKAPIRPQKPIPFDVVLQRATKAAEDAETALNKTPESGSPASKYYPQRRINMLSSQHNLRRLQNLHKTL